MAHPTPNNNTFPVSSIEEFTQTLFNLLICGGGTASLAIATRLSEDPSIAGSSGVAPSPFILENHGTTGPIRTTFNDAHLPIEDEVIKAAAAATNLPSEPVDTWSGDHIGFYHTLGTITRTGQTKGSEATPDASKSEASRRSARRDYVVSGRREVIISAGTIQSPQILELSGISDPDVLRRAEVKCIVENRTVTKPPRPQPGTQAIHDIVFGDYHICDSVALGAALDSRLRVKGVQSLSVADASVFPDNVSGDIVATVLAVAERAADLVKEDYGFV
ncbi:hypothetical protein BJX99DRAFT_254001 [Aspergillus californicus]